MGRSRILLSIIYALLAALIGGVIWGLIASQGYEFPILSWIIGMMTGYAVTISFKTKITYTHQIIAVITCLVGILLGKYFTFAHLIVQIGFNSLIDVQTMILFTEYVTQLFTGWDILFILLAVITAWTIPKKET